jgi:hypothetical protein
MMASAHELLLHLYPYDFRAMFESEMLAVLKSRKPRLAELVSLAAGAGREWCAKVTTEKYVRGRCLPDVRMMRPAGISREHWFGGEGLLDPGENECFSDTSL